MKEVWKPVVGYEGVYEVSNAGNIRRIPRNLKRIYPWAGYRKRTGSSSPCYPCVVLCHHGKPKVFRVHHLVMHAFIGKRPMGKESNHKNGDPDDASLKNLEYLTHSENITHARRILKKPGGTCPGSKNWRAILTESEVIKMRRLFESAIPIAMIAPRFRISRSQAWKIVHRQSWRHI